MTYLVTGAAGFIGFHTSLRLLARGEKVVGVDNINDYYDVRIKQARLEKLKAYPGFTLRQVDIADREAMGEMIKNHQDVKRIIHLAAQAGVRYSLINPYAYTHSNIEGHLVMLELARNLPKLEHMAYASSSSVYGGNVKLPFSVEDRVDNPISLYAATKKANELMSHCYSHLFKIPTTGFRFFTVYGPWGRPDMALFKFVKGILEQTPIDVYNHGEMFRDFTYVTDLVRGIRLLIDAVPQRVDDPATIPAWDTLSPVAPFRVVNIGNSDKVKLTDFIDSIEQACGRKAIRRYLDMQKGDVPATWADATQLHELTGYAPSTHFDDGVRAFVAWYRDYFGT